MGKWGHDPAVSAGVDCRAEPTRVWRVDIRRSPACWAQGEHRVTAVQLGLDGYAVFGMSGGGPFALGMAVADRAC